MNEKPKASARRLLPAGIIAALLLGGQAFGADAVISRGIFVGGVDVGGMTESEAKSAVKEEVKRLSGQSVTLQIGDTPVEATLSQLGLVWTNKDVTDEVTRLGTTGNIVQRYKAQKDLQHENMTYPLELSVDMETAKAFLHSCESYNTEPVDGSIYISDEGLPAVEGGTDGVSLLVDEAAGTVQQAVENWDGGELKIDMPVERVAPDISKDKLSMITDVLGKATTDYSASSWGRMVNVENGCSKISGTLLWPGDYFSVTDAVTPFTAENGYEQAPTYEENRVVDSYGGGICQVSTTLYNAVLKAELEVVSRSNHTMIVTYVDPSKDAAIAEGVMDMAFVNTSEYPIYIYGYCYNGTITFTIFGKETRPANRTIEFVSNVTSTTEPTGIVMYANPGQSIGYINQTQSPHTGYTAELWKNIYIDGNLYDSVQVNSSTYQAVATAYDVGVASSNPALTQAMYAAVGNRDLNQVQAIISGAYQAQSESQAASEAAAQQAAEQAASEAAAQQAAAEAAAQETWVDPNAQGDVYIVDPPEP